MRSISDYFVGAAAASALLSAACVGNDMCPKPVGQYRATYGIVQGNCTNIITRDLTLSNDPIIMDTSITGTTSGPSTTVSVNRVGCTLELEQSTSDMSTTSKLRGDLAVMSETTLQGQLLYAEFSADGTVERCRAQLDASYTKAPSATLGTAAEHALASP